MQANQGADAPSAYEYVAHHLRHWSCGSGFWSLNLDTLLISAGVALAIGLGLHHLHQTARAKGVPSRAQCAVELLFEFISGAMKALYPAGDRWASSLAFTYFSWIGAINLLALVPVDLLPTLLRPFGIPQFNALATADPNFTLGLGLSVLIGLILTPGRAHGWKGIWHGLAEHPLPHWILAPINLPFSLLSMLSKCVNLALRLCINMWVGDFLYLLIALLPWWIQWVAHFVWSIFHFLEIPLQAYLFTLISAAYIAAANASEAGEGAKTPHAG